MKKKRILLVDDDEPLLNTFRSILEKEGYFVKAAQTGTQALYMAEKIKFDLIILDIKLPDIQGDMVASKLRKQNNEIIIVLITGYHFLQDCIDALDIGIYEILLKPIPPDELLRVTKEAISTRARKEYWMGKNPTTKKAVTEYRLKKKNGQKVTIQKLSKKYQWSPTIATIQKNVSNLKNKGLW